MPVQFGTFISELAVKAGVAGDNPALKDLLSVNLQVPDDLANAINSNLLNITAAKQNAELKKYFHAQALNGIDSTLDGIMDELQMDDATREELKKEASSYKRVPALVKKVKELEEKKASAKSGDKAALQAEINKLNQEIASVKEAHKNDLKAAEQKAAETILNYAVSSVLASKNYANEALPKNVNVLTAQNLLSEELKSKKIKVVRMDDNTLKLVQSDNPDLDYLENHKPVQFNDFIDRLLGQHKMLKVTDPPKPGNTPPNPTFVPPGNGKTDNSRVLSAIDAQLEEIKASANGVTV